MKPEKINLEEAFRYLGYNGVKPEEQIWELAKKCEKELLEQIDGKYVYKYFTIEEHTNDSVKLEGADLILKGRSISDHLKNCKGVILFAATLSEKVDRLIRRLQINQMSAAVITDSMASSAIEQVCNLAEEEIKKNFTEKYLTWRFSPGYGDFPLEIQAKFLDVLNTGKRIGLNITDGGLMTPCKSVTAVIGVAENKIERKRRGCVDCLMYDKCAFRKRGEHCEI